LIAAVDHLFFSSRTKITVGTPDTLVGAGLTHAF
jgi:hypothetical protein